VVQLWMAVLHPPDIGGGGGGAKNKIQGVTTWKTIANNIG